MAADKMNDSRRVEVCCYFTGIRCTIFTIEPYRSEYNRDLSKGGTLFTPDRKNGVLKAFDGHWKSDLMNFNGGMLPWLLSYLRAVQCVIISVWCNV